MSLIVIVLLLFLLKVFLNLKSMDRLLISNTVRNISYFFVTVCKFDIQIDIIFEQKTLLLKHFDRQNVLFQLQLFLLLFFELIEFLLKQLLVTLFDFITWLEIFEIIVHDKLRSITGIFLLFLAHCLAINTNINYCLWSFKHNIHSSVILHTLI